MCGMNAPASPAARICPDYAGGSIANLMSSIAHAFEVPHTACQPLPASHTDALRGHAHVLLVLVDGLGLHALHRHRPHGALAAHLRASLTSVFPSTTATAITTLLTGVPPAAHAVTGWHVWFEELDAIAAVLPGYVRGSEESIAQRSRGQALFDQASFFDVLPADCHMVAPRRIVDSSFNLAHSGRAQRHGYTTLAQFFDAIERCTRQGSRRTYTYAYWPELDSIAHEYGVGSVQAADSLRRFDVGFERLLTALRGRDMAVVVTGDHGLIDAPAQEIIELEQHPALARTLARPLCGERRVAYCYVREGHRAAFEDYVRNELATRATLYESAAAIRDGWFGPGPAHPRLASRVGDYILVPEGRGTIKDWLPGEKRYRQIGVHGGLSADEMLVPLIVAEP
jgi:predicted AlkP superfamily pyrophosphatase or phosphodiesterase